MVFVFFVLDLIMVLSIRLINQNIYFSIQAGIQQRNLCIALEPEAAAVYCTTVDADPPGDPRRDFDRTLLAGPGTRNVIVDMGGMFKHYKFNSVILIKFMVKENTTIGIVCFFFLFWFIMLLNDYKHVIRLSALLAW